MRKILVIDNYDSFTYNLVHLIEEIVNHKITVWRNDQFDIEEVNNFDVIFFSPGPGIPDEAGLMKAVIKKYKDSKPLFGVCLGHQAIGECFGSELQNLEEVYHGVMTPIRHVGDKRKIFENVSDNFEGGRYHSWVIKNDTLSDEFNVTCRDSNGEIMGIEHKELPIVGVQFHPESVLTPEGKQMITNFLNHYC